MGGVKGEEGGNGRSKGGNSVEGVKEGTISSFSLSLFLSFSLFHLSFSFFFFFSLSFSLFLFSNL